jgi:SAM-dependent methyltransferase
MAQALDNARRYLEGARGLFERRGTSVERYWTKHTVNSVPFKTPAASEEYLLWRFAEYPLFKELMGLWGDHDGKTILDYGCGPGDDFAGFLVHTQAAMVIGADVSPKALELAARRVSLYGIDASRYRLQRLSDAVPDLPLGDASIDYVHCGGVLHHTSHPDKILSELRRALRPGGRGRIMVYNRDSVYFHLYTAYERMIVQGTFAGMTVEEAFQRNTDGPNCPISRCYRPSEFSDLASAAGLGVEYLGGYFSKLELELLESALSSAVADPRLGSEHREFLESLTFDEAGFARYAGNYAGIGGVFEIRRPASAAE